LALTRDQVVTAMLACAETFLDERAAHGGSAWRIADLPHGHDRVRDAVAERLGLAAAPAGPVPARPGAVAGARPVGLVRRGEEGGAEETACPPGGTTPPNPPDVHQGTVRDNTAAAVVLVAPLGRLAAPQLTWVCDRADQARVTPWRSVVLPRVSDPDAVLRDAAALGFGVDAASPWLRVTACAGRPGCASALADVRADAATFAERWPGRIVHVSGCARHCGRPAATEIDVTATSEGYQIAGI
jgi:precorrin-3B synthase